MRIALVSAAIVTVWGLAAPHSKELVEIKVRGYYFSAPATVPVTVAVEPAADNRMLVIEADSPEYYRSSSLELDGENEKRLHLIEFKSLPAGQYVLRAEVRSKSAVLGTATEGLVVTGIIPEQ